MSYSLEFRVVKRLVDILLSLIGIIVTFPFLPLIALLIKLDSNGPIFYLADRVGKGRKNFRMYKFRTMVVTPIEAGESVCPQYDPRVTTFGRFLRRTKMNELPQFINILKGEMSFVGPRPEAPDLAELYPEEAKKVFSVKPGLISPATVLGRNEEEVYPPGVDVKKYYIEKILPDKVKLDIEYIQDPTLFKDLKVIFAGGMATLIGMVGRRHIHDNRSQIYLYIADLFLIIGSYLSVNIVYSWNLSRGMDLIGLLLNLPLIILVRSLCNIYFGMYSALIRYISYPDIFGVLKGVTCGSCCLVLIGSGFGLNHYVSLIALIDWGCLILLLSGLRFSLRLYWEKTHSRNKANQKRRILIYGACDAGNAACMAFASGKYWPYEVVGFIDDSPDKYGKTLNGRKVMGNKYHIKELARLYRIDEVLISEPNGHPDKLKEIMAICKDADLKCRIFFPVEDLDSNGRRRFLSRSPEFSDVLHLQRFYADHNAVREILTDKTVLLYGSGAALGLELCRKIMQLGCKRLIIVDRYESYLNELIAALSNGFSQESIVPVLDNTDHIGTLEEAFENYRPNLVLHAGMRKYLPFLPVDLSDLGRTNYLCTFTLAKLAAKFHCELFVMISSLMAGKGGNLIADSLRIAEVSLEHFFSDTNTRLIIMRICDIVENRGGIVAIIENQIRNQETVILPSADAQTWLISKYSAAEFILQTLVEAKKNSFGAKVFACDAGSPVPLIEVAKKLANIYGLKLGSDLAIKYTGQSDEPVSRLPQEISSSTFLYPQGIKAAKGNAGVTNEEIDSVFKDFVLVANIKSATQDWKARTRKLIKLCEPGSP